MKFTAVWSQTLSQNVTLRVLLITLCITTVFLGASTVRLAIREPVIVERGCTSTTAKTGSNKHTSEEIEAFVRTAVPKRFDTQAIDSQLFLSADEQRFRLKEQQELKSRDISQRVVVNEVVIDGTKARVEADRIFTASNLRTAIPAPVVLELARVERTAMNPYGLILQRVSQVKTKEESK